MTQKGRLGQPQRGIGEEKKAEKWVACGYDMHAGSDEKFREDSNASTTWPNRVYL